MTAFVDLILPLTAADILELWRDRALKFQRRAAEWGGPPLLDWETMRDLIVREVLPTRKCRITYGGREVAPEFYCSDGRLDAARLNALVEQGVSIVVNGLHSSVPAIRAACRDAATHGLGTAKAAAVMTTGKGGALPMHYDAYDLVVLQMEGSKRWRVHGPRVPKPVKGDFAAEVPQTPPLFDDILHPGDLLYLPAGFWHQCENRQERSLHVGLALEVPDTDREEAEVSR
jgi:hypothetical protein